MFEDQQSYIAVVLYSGHIYPNTQKIPIKVEVRVEVERAMAQLYFWLELGELSQLGSAQLAIFRSGSSSAQLSSPKWNWAAQLIL